MPSSLGAPEILVILVVALIVLGPSKLPEAGRQIGKAMAEVRRWSQSVQSEIRDVIDVDPSPPTPNPPPPNPPPADPPPPNPPPPPVVIAPPPTPSSANGSTDPAPTAVPEVAADQTDASSGGQPTA